jgi:hypothetical protein
MKTAFDISSPGAANDILRSLIVALQLAFVIYKYIHTRRKPHKPSKPLTQHPTHQKEAQP